MFLLGKAYIWQSGILPVSAEHSPQPQLSCTSDNPITLLSTPQANPFLPHPHLYLTPHCPYRYAGLVSDPHLYLNDVPGKISFQIWRALRLDRFYRPTPPLPSQSQFPEKSRAAIAEHTVWVVLFGWLFQLLMCRKRCWGLGGSGSC